MQANNIASVVEYLQPVKALDPIEVRDVASDLAHKLKATTLLLTCADGGDLLELNHKDTMIILHGLYNDAKQLCDVLDSNEAVLDAGLTPLTT